MIYNIVGVQFRKGEFTDSKTGEVKAYDNLIFNCVYQPIDDNTEGMSVSEIKIKRKFIEASNGEVIKMINHKAEFELMPYGKSFIYTGIKLLD